MTPVWSSFLFLFPAPPLPAPPSELWQAERVAYAFVIAGEIALLGKLYWSRLAAVYPWFSSFIGFQLARSLVLYWVSPKKTVYGWIWVPTELAAWILCYCVVFELYSKVLESYPGIRRLTQWVLAAAAVVCLGVAGATLALDFSAPSSPYPILHAVNVVRRGAASTALLFLLAMLGYLAWYPVSLKRNLAAHAALNTLYCLVITLGVFCRNIIGPEFARSLSLALGVATAVFLWSWVLLFSREGENQTTVTAVLWSRRDEARLLGQLEAINRALTNR